MAQYDPEKVDKKAKEAYEKAAERADYGNLPQAIDLFKEAVRRDPNYVEAYLSIAGVYGQLKNSEQSIAYYEQAFKLDSNFTSDYRLPYSINLAGLGRFQDALNTIEALLARPGINENVRKASQYRKRTYLFALDFEKNNPNKNYVFNPVNLGSEVNTAESEYFPTLPIEGNEMVFTRRLNNFNEDFFITDKNSGTWTTARRLRGSINTPMNEGAQTISQDGLWLAFTGCTREGGMGSCDLYISFLNKEGWSEAINLGNKINTADWESMPCFSPDKRDLYFAARREGGFGGSDLYVSRFQPNGRWSEPENLGPGINTAGDESSPFIHADNQTLYFTSNGHPGYGEQDIYLTRKGGDGKWAKPQNLGYPINTINHEGTLFITADGKTAYYSSDRSDSKGGLDIYSFELREDVRPIKTLWVQGKVFDKKTNAGLPSAVELIDLATGQTISKVQTDEQGNYLITLPVGKDYAFNVARRGYLFYSGNYSLKGKSPDSTYKKDIPLQPIEVNAAIVLRNIFFDFNKFVLKPESRVELDRLVQLLKENPAVRIQIEGHTDNVGKAADNQKLSDNRAKAVVSYLVANGIAANRLVAKGFGATKPMSSNTSEEGRAENRRTEVKVIAR